MVVVIAVASGVVDGSGAFEGVFARSLGDGGGTEGVFARESNAGAGVAAGGALRPRQSPTMRCSGGGAGRRSAAGPGESASRRFCAPAGRGGGTAPLAGRIVDEAFDGELDGVPGRIADEAFEGLLDGVPGRIDGELVSAPGRIPDEAFDGDVEGVTGRTGGRIDEGFIGASVV